MTPEIAETLTTASYRAFLVQLVGPQSGVPASEVANLVTMGLLTKTHAKYGWTVPGTSPRCDPFQFAVMMAGVMVDEAAEGNRKPRNDLKKAWDDVVALRSASLKRWIKRVNYRLRYRLRTGRPSLVRYTAPDALTPAEAGAWLSSRTRAAANITNIGTRDAARVRQLVTQAVSEGVSWQDLEDELQAEFAGSMRDWSRVARTELQGAYNEGTVAASVAKFGDSARVARVPEFDACEKCMELFVFNGRPRIFEVRQLIANGTNVGMRRADWSATIWPIHPNCRCDVVSVPPGYTFSSSWELVPMGAAA